MFLFDRSLLVLDNSELICNFSVLPIVMDITVNLSDETCLFFTGLVICFQNFIALLLVLIKKLITKFAKHIYLLI